MLPILQFPDERLRITADPVIEVNNTICNIVDQMLVTMYDQKGIGLAATQVDIHQQIIVVDISENKSQPLILINPVIVQHSGRFGIQEGCLSVQGIQALIFRAGHLIVRALDLTGKAREIEVNGILAICIQHEMDHLLGKLFIDYLHPFKLQQLIKKRERSAKKNKPNIYLSEHAVES